MAETASAPSSGGLGYQALAWVLAAEVVRLHQAGQVATATLAEALTAIHETQAALKRAQRIELVLRRIVLEATPPAAVYGVWLPRARLAPELLAAARAALAGANEEEADA